MKILIILKGYSTIVRNTNGLSLKQGTGNRRRRNGNGEGEGGTRNGERERGIFKTGNL